MCEVEAYQWIWSKHPALSYYSKPPLIAYTQFLGTHIWGDTEFGVRFFSPVIAAVLSLLSLRFLTRYANARLATLVVLAMTVTPLTALGATVMTVDPLSVLFWTAAMFAGWRAAQPEGTTREWLWVGLWMGLGCLSKHTNLAQCVCWGVFFLLWPPARRHLRRPGPYLALLVTALFYSPVVIWNAQHHWISAVHVASDGQLGEAWHRTYVGEFLLTEAALLHPLFFVAAMWAAVAFWRRGRGDPLSLYLFSMGAPLFLGYFILSFHSRILGNWIAPAIIPLFFLTAIYWWKRWEENARALKPLFIGGFWYSAVVVVILHAPNLVAKVVHRKLPAETGPFKGASAAGRRGDSERLPGTRAHISKKKPASRRSSFASITGSRRRFPSICPMRRAASARTRWCFSRPVARQKISSISGRHMWIARGRTHCSSARLILQRCALIGFRAGGGTTMIC